MSRTFSGGGHLAPINCENAKHQALAFLLLQHSLNIHFRTSGARFSALSILCMKRDMSYSLRLALCVSLARLPNELLNEIYVQSETCVIIRVSNLIWG